MEDLFDDIESLPIEVQNVLESFSEGDNTYETCQNLVTELN